MEEYSSLFREGACPPRNLRAQVRGFLRDRAIDCLVMASHSNADRFLRCLYCHYVFDDQREAFERILLALKRIGQFVDTDTCVRMTTGEVPIDGRYFHLSFDDGFRNNFSNALPVLQKHAVPAIFFVPSAYVGADWQGAKDYCFGTSTAYNGVIEMVRWDDLKRIVDAGYEVGSHTRHHVRLSEVSHQDAVLQDEILGSKRELEQHLSVECRYISWPYGRLQDVDQKALEAVQASGYAACFAAVRGSVLPGETSRFSIPRHHFEPQWPLRQVNFFARGNWETV